MYASGGAVTYFLKYLYNASGELEYIQRKKDNFSDPNRYDLFAVIHNGKGEITKLVQTRKQTSSGVGFQYRVVANYTYDAYGNVTVSSPVSGENIGTVNPVRYKDYIYDTETNWYYLQTRYYDPTVGRFLNADGYMDTGDSVLGTNMFAYCGNNPVKYSDSTGQLFGIDDVVLFSVATVTAAVVVGICLLATMSETMAPTLPAATTSPKLDVKPKVENKEKDIAPAIPKDPPKDPVHHVVAKADRRAEESRRILRDVGIDPLTDPRNLLVLPRSYHATLHTTAYHNYVTERLRNVAGDKARVEATLASLKAEILARSAAGIRWD